MADDGASRRRAALAGRDLRRLRPSWAWLAGGFRSVAISFLAFAVTLQLTPGTQVPERGVETLISLVAMVFVVGALLRPVLIRLTVLTGVVGLLLSGFLAQALVLGIALSLLPTIEPIAFPEIVIVAWCVTVVAALLNWIVDASSQDVFLSQVMGRSIRAARRAGVSGPGLLVVQLDGVAEPLVRQASATGAIPFLSGLLRSGSHRLRPWHTGLPSTTPAGQARLLHGHDLAIPGFRWWDKELGRMVVCNRPQDAAAVERALTTGDGLLAHDGASVANLFTGDAPYRAVTMAKAQPPGTERGAAEFAVARSGLVRSLVLFAGQVVAEWFQGRRQRRRDVLPRVPRGGAFLFLRGLTTVVLKDLSVAIVADQMARGAPVVYVDLLDFDEVAHHAGPTRPESLRTLEGLDRVVQFFHELAAEVGRDYEIAVVSDHGQTQGTTFQQLEGRSIVEAVREIVEAEVHGSTGSDEAFGPAHMLTAGSPRTPAPLRPAVSRALARRDGDTATAAVEVAVSGSLAHIYLAELPGRLTREEVEAAHPSLLPGLRALRHVGVVMTRRADGVLVVENGDGWRTLEHGVVASGEGHDPLEPFGATAAADLTHLSRTRHVGDVVLLGRYDPDLQEVAAFEELVGSHGGLGGWQTQALVIHPSDWDVPAGTLSGIDVHRLLLDRLESHSLRGTPAEADA